MMISHSSKLFFLSFIYTTFICLSSSSTIPTYQHSILGPNLDKRPSQDEAIQLFQLWKKEHGRVYKDIEELAKRFDIFVSNVKYITESNAKRRSPSDYLLGLNKFSDWSNEDFQETYLHELDMPTDSGMKLNDLPCSAPSSKNWTAEGVVTAVKDQGKCGTCWAFSAVGAIEAINAITTGELISLSEQEALDCDNLNHGCEGGRVDKAFNWVLSNGGIASEATYPYKAKKDNCSLVNKVPNSASIDGYGRIAKSDNGLLCATVIQPISVCLNASDFRQYKSGIYDGRNCQKSNYANHCVLIVGYDSKEGVDFWIVKNSWGKDWGMNGYIWIKRNTHLPYGVCGMNYRAYNPIKNKHAFNIMEVKY